MNKQENIDQIKIDKDLALLFGDVGKEKAPADFTDKLFTALNSDTLAKQIYFKPIIPLYWKYTIVLVLVFILIYSSYNLAAIQYVSYLKEFISVAPTDFSQAITFDFSALGQDLFSSTWFIWVVTFIGAGSISLLFSQRLESNS